MANLKRLDQENSYKIFENSFTKIMKNYPSDKLEGARDSETAEDK